jgi:hypothetical protein
MLRYILVVAALSQSSFLTPPTRAQQESHSEKVKKGDVPTITITKLDISDAALELTCEIRNNCGRDPWILTGFTRAGATISAFIDQDGQTLLLRRRLDLPWSGFAPFPVLNQQ